MYVLDSDYLIYFTHFNYDQNLCLDSLDIKHNIFNLASGNLQICRNKVFSHSLYIFYFTRFKGMNYMA